MPPRYRRVTAPEEIERVQEALVRVGITALKLHSTIRSWQLQAAAVEAGKADGLVEPKNPALYISCEISADDVPAAASSLDATAIAPDPAVVLLIFGDNNTPAAIASRVAAIATTDPNAPASRNSLAVFVAYHCADSPEATAILREMLAATVPLQLPFMLTGSARHLSATLFEPLAAEHGARLVHNCHQQWARLPADAASNESNLAPTPPTASSSAAVASDSILANSSSVTASPSPSPPPSTDASDSSTGRIVVAPLRREHAAMVEKWWPYASASTATVMPFLIDNLLTRCVYVESSDSAELEPVCWALAQTYGGIGMLHTLAEHRGRGHARRCIDSLCAGLIAEGRTPFCFIGDANIASQTVFRGLDFQPTNDADWITWMPSTFQSDAPH